MNMLTQIALGNDNIGDVKLLGRHGGAYVTYYIIVDIVDGDSTLLEVVPTSEANGDGTFGTRYVAA